MATRGLRHDGNKTQPHFPQIVQSMRATARKYPLRVPINIRRGIVAHKSGDLKKVRG
jgi:hypothetical protein